MMSRLFRNHSGVSLIELIVTLTILSILAAVVLPSAQLTAKRSKEIELRRNLRTIRTAIDDFKKTYDKAVDEKKIIPSMNKMPNGYPEDLKLLVEGFDFGGLLNYKKKFLRRIPEDPFSRPMKGEEPKWGLRSSIDEPDSTTWGGEDVFDVYSASDKRGLDGVPYAEW